MKLTEANHQAKILDNKSNDVTKILDNLKPTKLNKIIWLFQMRMSRN